MKILDNITFTIPFKNDSTDRIININLVIKYIRNFFDTEIYVGEEGKLSNELSRSILHFNFDDDNNGFKKCFILNELAKRSTNEVVCSYDSDCFLLPEQYEKSVELILEDKADLVIPFDGTCYNIDRSYIPILERFDLEKINVKKCSMRRKNTVGGINFYNKKKFIEWGMWNQNFRAWGAEDDEFIYRAKALGYRIFNVPGCLYHLNHSRNQFGRPKNIFYSNNMTEFNKIRNLSLNDLKKYISEWDWIK